MHQAPSMHMICKGKRRVCSLLGRQCMWDGLRASARVPGPHIAPSQEWLRGVGLLDFLRDVGKHARVGAMLSRDSVRSRMELDNEGMSYTE